MEKLLSFSDKIDVFSKEVQRYSDEFSFKIGESIS